ncbi:alpha/beta fold hydrolase [Myxosarcina sp. GI1]|uniref:alpha/beta fold hydrolase n=1 Tax=Myxosarcina sp. GI1 TaxID=1541065 RepID=UPI000564E89C|nr:alpha/beta hydrolase [Myxosarcina sp. GI1]
MPSIKLLGVTHQYELTPPVTNSQLPVLVFVHGWLLSHRYWQPVIELLQSKFQCLIYDLRGFGDSSAKTLEDREHSYSLAAYARDLEDLLQKLEIERAWIIGHSLGGSIALWAASRCPQRVKGVICLNSGGGIYLKEDFERFRNAGKQLVKFRPGWLKYFPFLSLLFARMMVARPLSLAWGHQRIIDFTKASESAALGALLKSTTEAEVHLLPRLVAQLEQPVYFIGGANDKIMEFKYVNHLASFHHLFKQDRSNVYELPECGHLAMVECPEKVAAIATEILNKHGY